MPVSRATPQEAREAAEGDAPVSLADFEREAFRLQSVLGELSVMDRRDLHDVFAVIAEAAAAALHVGRVSLWTYNARHSAIDCAAVWQEGRLTSDDTIINAETHPTYWAALQSARTLPIADAAHDPVLAEFRPDYVNRIGIGAMLDSSIRVEHTTYGIVCVEHLGSPRVWTALERNFVASLGDRVGLALLVDRERALQRAVSQAHKMEAIGLMAGGLAHDFNNVLHVVQSSADVAIDGLAHGEDPRQDLETIRNAAKRAAAMTRRLLTVARQEPMEFQSFDLNELMQDFAPIAQRLVPEQVQLTLALEGEPLFVEADRSFVDQAMLNLITNAAHSMPQGGQLTIETARVEPEHATSTADASSAFVRLSVRDTGNGIAHETLPNIFDPFFSTKGPDGTGLGLAVVYGGMRQHGGSVSVESTVGHGSVFNLLFPARQSA